MLNICCNTCAQICLSFNYSKSHCICFGSYYNLDKPPLQIGNEYMNWSTTIKYLGIKISSGKHLTFDISEVRQACFSACNCVFAAAKYNDQIMHLSLQVYCKPVLTYGLAAIYLTCEQMRILNCCWNNVYRRIFGFNKWESV